jgi:leucyl-tRNA synthetase
VQVNGKLRSLILVPADAAREQVEQTAIGDARTRDFIGGKTIKKIVVVPGKLVNIVV